jgi:hypothetical protein
MCGTNLGDIIPDVLKVSAGSGLTMLAFMFALLMSAERATARGSEAFYWIAILVVRAAATNIADYSIDQAHLTYLNVIAALALLFSGILVLQHRSKSKQIKGTLPPTGGFYWLTMLLAGVSWNGDRRRTRPLVQLSPNWRSDIRFNRNASSASYLDRKNAHELARCNKLLGGCRRREVVGHQRWRCLGFFSVTGPQRFDNRIGARDSIAHLACIPDRINGSGAFVWRSRNVITL